MTAMTTTIGTSVMLPPIWVAACVNHSRANIRSRRGETDVAVEVGVAVSVMGATIRDPCRRQPHLVVPSAA